jgi:inner membrane protein
MNDRIIPNTVEFIRNSHLLRVLLVGFLVILLQIPIGLIRGVVGERQARQQEAFEEITSKWGRQQSITGPLLTVPYLHRITETDQDGNQKIRTQQRAATFLPGDLHISGTIHGEVRYRGIFQVPVYTAELEITGTFTRPDFSEWEIDGNDIAWDRAYLSLRISDARAITNQVSLLWNEQALSFLPGTGDYGERCPGIHVPLKGQMAGETFPFSCRLNVNGSGGVYFAPLGKTTVAEVRSNWGNPSFQGNWLPVERTVSKDGFQARWNIPFLGRNYPQQWKNEDNPADNILVSRFGVDFITPMDHYRMSQRSIKYEILFLSLTFAVLWLFQVLAKLRIHSIQYLLVGGGLCLFYLLELSLAEHLGFLLAYLCATLAVTLLIWCYCLIVLHSYLRALIVSIVLLLLYGYLYILLMNQDYALLIGSLGLFVALAIIMYITRKVDWYAVKS